MVHGAVDRAAGMIRVARSIAEYPVVRYDRRGYGRSNASSYPISFEQHVEDLERVIDGVPSIIFGHSYGGSIALSAASRGRQPIRAVVSYEAPRGWEEWWPPPPAATVDPGDAAEHFVRRMVGEERWRMLPTKSRERLRAQGVLMVHELNTQLTQQYLIGEIAVPVHVGVGELSGAHAQRAAELTTKEAKSGTLVRIPKARHDAPMTHASAIAAMIKNAATQGSLT